VIHTLRLLAGRITALAVEARDLHRRMNVVITAHTPALLERPGVGPDNAAALLIAAGDNPDRLTSDASFAALCGVSPVDASSGKTTRPRLNRGGNRPANAALYRIVLTRLRHDERTRAYLERRITEGKTRREAIRCTKRYVAREIHHLLQPPPKLSNRPPALDMHRGVGPSGATSRNGARSANVQSGAAIVWTPDSLQLTFGSRASPRSPRPQLARRDRRLA
jgi:hypothetical protein